MQNIRWNLLDQISDITEHHCVGCADRKRIKEVCNATCPYGLKLMSIGEELKRLTTVKRSEKYMARTPKTNIEKAVVERMLSEGKPKSAIANHYGVDPATIHYYIRKWNESTVPKREKEKLKVNSTDEYANIISELKKKVQNYESLEAEYKLQQESNRQLTEEIQQKHEQYRQLEEKFNNLKVLEEERSVQEEGSLKCRVDSLEKALERASDSLNKASDTERVLKMKLEDVTKQYHDKEEDWNSLSQDYLKLSEENHLLKATLKVVL
ncbi:hypothetical protein [Bacillus weihaiensis]|uniref:hypothetical protein n=1 Tax=Bacillus weihaiensis TaxID=1547283 RepID=UPI002354639C|nr:hypothetical protein [Bacillus weihaiensis]